MIESFPTTVEYTLQSASIGNGDHETIVAFRSTGLANNGIQKNAFDAETHIFLHEKGYFIIK